MKKEAILIVAFNDAWFCLCCSEDLCQIWMWTGKTSEEAIRLPMQCSGQGEACPQPVLLCVLASLHGIVWRGLAFITAFFIILLSIR